METSKEKESPTSNAELASSLYKDDTFVITNEKTGETFSSGELRHRKALALAKANARHVIKSWQKRHLLLDTDGKSGVGSNSRPYIQHISEAVHNENGEKIYFRWQEAGKVMNHRQPKAVSKLYAQKRKRLAKKKASLGVAASKSAPNQGEQDSLAHLKDLRVHTATTDNILSDSKIKNINNNDGAFHGDSSFRPTEIPTTSAFQSPARKGARVKFDLPVPPSGYHGVKEAFLSNSAKTKNRRNVIKTTSATTAAKSNSSSTPGSHPEESNLQSNQDGQTDSDKENANAIASCGGLPTRVALSKNSQDKTKADQKPPQSKKSTLQSQPLIPHKPLMTKPTKQIAHTPVRTSDLKPSQDHVGKSRVSGNVPECRDRVENKTRHETDDKDNRAIPIDEKLLVDSAIKLTTLNLKGGGVSGDDGSLLGESVRTPQKHKENNLLKNESAFNMKEKSRNALIDSDCGMQAKNKEGYTGKRVSNRLNEEPKRPKEISSGRQKNKISAKQKDTVRKLRVDSNDNAPKRQMYKNTPIGFSKSTRNLDEDTNPVSKTDPCLKDGDSLGKASNTTRNGFGLEKYHLKTIVEGQLESSSVNNMHRNENSDVLIAKPYGVYDTTKSDMKSYESHLMHRTIGLDNYNLKAKVDDRMTNGKPVSCRPQVPSTQHAQQPSVGAEVADSRLSVSWPKTHMPNRRKQMAMNVTHSDEKATRIDLLAVDDSGQSSPPLSINRYKGEDDLSRTPTHPCSLVGPGHSSSLSYPQATVNVVDHAHDKPNRMAVTYNNDAADPLILRAAHYDGQIDSRGHRKGSVQINEGVVSNNARVTLNPEQDNRLDREVNGDRKIISNDSRIMSQQPHLLQMGLKPLSGEQLPREPVHGLPPCPRENVKENFQGSGWTDSTMRENGNDSNSHGNERNERSEILQSGANEPSLKQSNNIPSHSTNEKIDLKTSGGDVKEHFDPVDDGDGSDQKPQYDLLCGINSARPPSPGMARFLDRPMFWTDGSDGTQDDDIKYINDEDDFYEVFGYDAETAEILRDTQIFPATDFQDLEASGKSLESIGKLSPSKDAVGPLSNSKANPGKKLKGDAGTVKGVPKAVTSSGRNIIGPTEPGKKHVSKEEMALEKSSSSVSQQGTSIKVKGRARIMSLASRTESDDFLYRNVPLAREGRRQYTKGSQLKEEAILISTSSSSPSISQTSQTSPMGIPQTIKEDSFRHKNVHSGRTIGQFQGISSERDTVLPGEQKWRKKSVERVKLETRPFPPDELRSERATTKTLTGYPLEAKAIGHSGLQTLNQVGGVLQQYPPVLHPKIPAKVGHHIQRRRIFSDTDTDKLYNWDMSAPVNAIEPHTFRTLGNKQEKLTNPLSKDGTVYPKQQPPGLSSKAVLQHPAAYPQYPSSQGSDSNIQRGFSEVGHQPKQHLNHNHVRGTAVQVPKGNSPGDYGEATSRIRHRLVDQSKKGQKLTTSIGGGQRPNPPGVNVTKNVAGVPNTTHQGVHKPGHRHLDTLAPCRDTLDRPEVANAVPNFPVRDIDNGENLNQPPAESVPLSDKSPLAKPRKLKPIIHYPGMQKRHQHLASGL